MIEGEALSDETLVPSEAETAPNLPDTYKDMNHAQVDRLLMAARLWFTREDVEARIRKLTDEVLKFLKDNKQIMSRSNTPNDIFVGSGPWRHIVTHDLHDNPAAADLRRTLLRRNVFSEGMAFMLFRMWEELIIGRSQALKLFIDDGTNFTQMEITQEMLFQAWVEPKKTGFTLSSLRNKFLQKKSTNTGSIRNEWVLPMVCLGIWSASKITEDVKKGTVEGEGHDEESARSSAEEMITGRLGEFSIVAGIVPKVFHELVLLRYLDDISKET